MPQGSFWQLQFLARLIDAAPWLIGLFGGLALVNFGPLGRAIRARLLSSDRSDSDARLEGIAADLAQVLERLDYLERLAVQQPTARPLPPPKKETTPV
jgi:hypothetical protein